MTNSIWSDDPPVRQIPQLFLPLRFFYLKENIFARAFLKPLNFKRRLRKEAFGGEIYEREIAFQDLEYMYFSFTLKRKIGMIREKCFFFFFQVQVIVVITVNFLTSGMLEPPLDMTRQRNHQPETDQLSKTLPGIVCN